MFMRYIGGGIGHRATDFIKQSITAEPTSETLPNTQEVEDTTASFEGITENVPQHHPQLGGDDIEEDADSEGVDSEEEEEFGYGDGADCDTSGEEEEVLEEEDDDDFADL
jgi:hypothetical protein